MYYFVKLLIVLVVFTIFVSCGPIRGNLKRRKAEEKGHDEGIFSKIMKCNKKAKPWHNQKKMDLFQGDIIMTPEIRRAIKHSGPDYIILDETHSTNSRRRGKRPSSRGRQRRAAMAANGTGIWPSVNGEVRIPYVLEQSLSASAQSAILSAMGNWTTYVPCIKFVERQTQVDYISFFNGIGCYSDVGRIGRKQTISIGTGCDVMGIAAHEIGHALGFWHEQSRPDRDNYVRILWDNIETGREDDFKKILGGAIDSRGVDYDFDSLMHYGPTTFAKSQGLNTIVKLDNTTEFGQRTNLSDGDTLQARLMYCNDCNLTNAYTTCPGWKEQGYCEENSQYYDFMLNNCQRSCHCDVCENNLLNCSDWASNGLCTDTAYEAYMAIYCRQSCQRCS